MALGEDLYLALDKGSEAVGTLAHASTFAAHPVGAAAALKTIEIIERDRLVDHAAAMGERLEQGIRAFEEHPLVGDIRRVGLVAGIDFLRRDEHDVPIDAREVTSSSLVRSTFVHLVTELGQSDGETSA